MLDNNPNQNHKLNPQTETDQIGDWFEVDKSFKKTRLLAYFSYKFLFIKKTQKNHFSQFLANLNLKRQYLFYFMTKNVYTILISILALATFTGVAAQALAPADLKPSALYERLFKANQQIERNPYSSLKPDQNNFVSTLDQCDLSLKYPKKLSDGSTFDLFREGPGAQLENPKLIQAFVLQSALTEPNQKLNYDFRVECFEPNYKYETLETSQSITKEALQQKTGWFITQADLKNIKEYQGKGYGRSVSLGSTIEFEFKNRKYIISGIERTLTARELGSEDFKFFQNEVLPTDFTEKMPGIYTNQVQIQFNSLTDNISDKEIKALPPTTKPDQTQTTIKTEPLNAKLSKNAFRPNEGCNQGLVEEKYLNLPDEPNYTYQSQVGGKYAQMVVANRNYSYKVSQDFVKDPVAKFDQFIKSSKLDATENGVKSLNPINVIFNNACGGAEENYNLDLNPVKYGDQSKAVLVWAGQDSPLSPSVYVYAQNGSDLVLLSSMLYEYDDQEIQAIIKSCGYDQVDPKADFAKFDQKCYEQKVSSPQNIAKANQIAQDLIKVFALKR